MGYLDKPKISGLVYNCALNCALPTILEQISAYAHLEVSEHSNLPNPSEDRLFSSYLILKDTFAESYNLSELQRENFTWTVFLELIHHHDFTGIEILFIPVLRELLKRFSKEDGITLDELQRVEMRSNGRYPELDYYDVEEHFNPRFNITATVHKFNHETNEYDEVPTFETSTTPETMKKIHVYLRENHYELLPREDLTDAMKHYEMECKRLPEMLGKAQDSIACGDSAYHSNIGLANIFTYGHKELSHFIAQSEAINGEQRVQLEQQIQPDAEHYVALYQDTFDSKTHVEKETIATILLSLLQNSDDTYPSVLLDKMCLASGKKESRELAELVFIHWDNLNCPDIQNVIDKIKTPLEQTPVDKPLQSISSDKSKEQAPSFYFNCMAAFAAAGAALLVVAILLNPIVSMPFVIGVAAAGMTSLLISGSMFLVDQMYPDDTSNVKHISPT
ncbi:MAG: hypothetical protein P1U61_08210 [Legionellaceae bacterium]|nr:hypothetical protein [Legionellaceae bacterium]